MPRGSNKRKEDEKRQRLVRMNFIAPLWRKNWTCREIRDEAMKELGLKSYALSTVYADIKELLQEWKAERMEDTDEKVTAELMRLDYVIKEAWAVWEGSKRYKRNADDTKDIPCGGNSKYLDIVLRAVEQRRKLLGLDKTVVDVTGDLQGNIEIKLVGDDSVGISGSEAEILEREGLKED